MSRAVIARGEQDMASRAVQRRGLGARVEQRLLGAAGILLVLLLWEAFALLSRSTLIVGPIAVMGAGVELIVSGELWEYGRSSALVFAVGLLLGTVTGLLVGLLLGRFRLVDAVLDPYISALYTTPLVALVPVLVVLLGFGPVAKSVIVAMFAFFPVAINTAAGVKGVPRDLTELARSFCSNELQLWRDIVLPSAAPFIVAGMRLAVGRALIGVVVAEFETSITGLGYLILLKSRRFEMAESLVPAVTLMITGFALYALLRRTEARLAPWQS